MAMAGGVGAPPSDDVLRDIFSRLPDPVDLLRCAGTCRRWLRVLGDPAFLSRSEKNGRRASFILGAFSQMVVPVRPPEERKLSLWPPQFERLHTLPAPDGSRASDLSLFFPNDGGLFDYASPLASRRGLLLLRIRPAPFDSRKLHLAVCHPVIGERSTRLIPPPPLNVDPINSGGDDVTGYAIVTAANHHTAGGDLDHQRHPAFQVLFTAMDSDKHLRAYSYCSATGRWTASTKCSHVSHVSGLTMSGPRAGTVAERTVHWLYRDATSYYTLDVGTDAAEHPAVSLTKIPIQVGHDPAARRLRPPFPCTVRGRLAFVNKTDIAGRLELWTKREKFDDRRAGGWRCSELIHPPQPGKIITMFAFLESKGAMLVQIDHGLFSVDLESKELDRIGGDGSVTFYTRKLCGQGECRGCNSCGDCTYNKRVIYEMDWPSYLLHLYV